MLQPVIIWFPDRALGQLWYSKKVIMCLMIPFAEASSSVPVCKLAWTGDVRAPAFEKFQELHATSAADARKQLESRSVAHYWDLAEAALADTG